MPSQDHHQHPGCFLWAPRAQPQPVPQPRQCVPGEHRVHVNHSPPGKGSVPGHLGSCVAVFWGISRRAGCAASPVLSPSERSLGGGAAAAQPAPKASVPSTSSQRGRYQVRREASSPSCGRELALHGAVLERGWGCEGVARSCKTCACLQGCCAEPCARGCACRGAAWSSRNVHSYLQRRCMELCQRA